MRSIISLWAEAVRAAWNLSFLWDAAACAGILVAVWGTMAGALDGKGHQTRRFIDIWSAPTSIPWAILAMITALGLALRLHGRGDLPYWWDELLAVWMAQSDIPTMLRSLFTPTAPASDFTPPLFYLILHVWTEAFGIGEAQTRVLTAYFSTAQIPLLALLGRRLFSWRIGIAAALMLAFSPPSIFYAQQIRCYALLGMLAVASALCTARAVETGRTRDLLVLGVVGTLFLYTHYVASWLWLGMGTCAFAATLPAWKTVPRMHLAARVAVVASGFALAVLCPFFAPISFGQAGLLEVMAIVFVAGLMLFLNTGNGPYKRGFREAVYVTVVFAVPGGLLCLWMVPSGVIKVIGGPGTSIPGSYGILEFSRMLADYSGPQAVLEPGMMGLSLFLVLSGLYFALAERPRQALLLMGWAGLPMAMAMAVQNPSMNLVRYLIATLPAVILLVALALDGSCRGIAVLAGTSLRTLWPSGISGRSGVVDLFSLAAPALLGAVILGNRAYSATAFPATRTNIEDYPAAASALARQGGFLLAGESQNLIRALSWYMERQGTATVAFDRTSHRLGAANIFLDGRFWHGGVPKDLGLDGAVSLGGPYGEIALYRRSTWPGSVAADPDGAFTVKGSVLRDSNLQGEDVAYAGANAAGLVQLYKKRPGRALYLLAHGPISPGRWELSLEGVVVGPGSAVTVRLRDASGGDILAGELRQEGIRPLPGLPSELNGDILSVVLEHPLPPGEACLDVVLRDDGSGVIYSSNVILRSVTIRPPGSAKMIE